MLLAGSLVRSSLAVSAAKQLPTTFRKAFTCIAYSCSPFYATAGAYDPIHIGGASPGHHAAAWSKLLRSSWLHTAMKVLLPYVVLLLIVRAVSSDPRFTSFPEECPTSLSEGCARVAQVNPHRNGDLQPLRISSSFKDVYAAVNLWVRKQPRTTILYEQVATTRGVWAGVPQCRVLRPYQRFRPKPDLP